MTTKEKPFYEQQYTAEERELAEHIIGLEKSALDKWFKGDTSGYERLWSKRSFTYFDAVVTERVDDHATIARFLETIEGKLHADSYDFRYCILFVFRNTVICPRKTTVQPLSVWPYISFEYERYKSE